MTKGSVALVLSAFTSCVLAVSCGSSDSGNSEGGGSSGVGAHAGASSGMGGDSDVGGASVDGGNSGNGGSRAVDPGAGAAGEVKTSDGGAAGSSGAGAVTDAATAGSDDGGAAGGMTLPVDTSPLNPSAIPDLALWLDGNAQAFSDQDENFPLPLDSGRVRSVPEVLPLTGSWKAASAAQRPLRVRGGFDLRPIENGSYLQDTAGRINTDDSTLAISYRTLNSNSSQGAVKGQIESTPLNVGIGFAGDILGVFYNGTSVLLKKHIGRALHATVIIRFSPTGFNVLYDVEGFRSSESVEGPIAHQIASNFLVGYDGNSSSNIYGFVSQVVGVNRAVSDVEASRLMTWLSAQPVPEAYPVTKPLVAIVGDSIANGDQTPGWRSWAFSMLSNLNETRPDVQLLNDSYNGGGIPAVKNSTYSERVLPWYSPERTKNILVVAGGSNDLLNGATSLSDNLDRYYGLLKSARTTGWKTVACTILPRTDAQATSGTFEAARVAFNADLRAHSESYDALADVAAIPAMGAPGASDNAIYYSSDKVHPVIEGHKLLEPVYRAAVAGLL